jgi:hypothetical protein
MKMEWTSISRRTAFSKWISRGFLGGGMLVALLTVPRTAPAQGWNWTREDVDIFGKFTAIAVDGDGNIHVAYAGDGGSSLKYAYRAAGAKKWYSMVLDKQLGDFATNMTLDAQGNPRICYTPRELKYAQWNGQKWTIQQIAAGTGTVEYNCSVTLSPDGTPHVSWYHTRASDGSNFLHLKYATLLDGVWMAKTVDFDGEDGKWNSLVLDTSGRPQVIYSVFPRGELKYATWNGKEWQPQAGITPASAASAGMGNSLVLDAQGQPEISFYETAVEYGAGSRGSLKFAWRKGAGWDVQTVDSVFKGGSWVGFRSTLVLDKQGLPHICYEDGGSLKHAFWNGTRWHIQLVAPRATEPYLYSAMAIDRNDTLYISYRDPSDGTLKVAVGRSSADDTATALQQEKKD